MIIVLNINISMAQTYTEGFITGIVLNQLNEKKTCKCNTVKNKTQNKVHSILYQTADTELENNAYYHITQNHQCYEKKMIQPLSIMEKLVTLFILIIIVFGSFMFCLTSTDEEKSFCCGLMMGMLIDNLLNNDDDCD